MWINQILLAVLSFVFGLAVSSGTFAFVLIIGVVPRILCKAKLAKKVKITETMICIGTIVGCIATIFAWNLNLRGIVGQIVLFLFGMFAGMFVGCTAVALAEILHSFPILFHRLRITKGLMFIMLAMALGKMMGSLCYFIFSYGMI